VKKQRSLLLVRDSRELDEESGQETSSERLRIERSITELEAKASKLLDGYLEGVVPVEAYRTKSDQLSEQRRTFERRRCTLLNGPESKTAQVEQLARQAAAARPQFVKADTEGKRRILKAVLLNAQLQDGDIASSS
jgi:hypothetical protein